MQSSSEQPATSIGELSVRKSGTTDASPGKVWSAIGDFSGIAHWHPAVASADIEDRQGTTVRVIALNGGGTIVEALVDWDDAARSYTYRVLEGPLPVENYRSTLSVTAEGEGSRIEWQASFDAKGASHDEATGVIAGIYDAGIAGLIEASKA